MSLKKNVDQLYTNFKFGYKYNGGLTKYQSSSSKQSWIRKPLVIHSFINMQNKVARITYNICINLPLHMEDEVTHEEWC